jgi:hypothetical protein
VKPVARSFEQLLWGDSLIVDTTEMNNALEPSARELFACDATAQCETLDRQSRRANLASQVFLEVDEPNRSGDA